MIPAAIFAMLAISRLGAVHAVVFGGFSPASLAQRIEASEPRVILSASCGIEGNKGPLPYRPLVERALSKSTFTCGKTIVWQRSESKWQPLDQSKGQYDWQDLVKNAKARGLKADCTPIKSNDPLYIIYTSGTTGLPKGVVREAGGHAVGLNLSMRYIFGIYPKDIMFCASDIGWVVGHSYIVYGPLLAGATTVLFEGKPVGTPDAGTFWRILAEYNVHTFFTAPTALRAIRRDDPGNQYLIQRGERGDLRNLRALFVAGERSEPNLIQLYQDFLQKYCATAAQVIDNWWSSETGSPISALALCPKAGLDFKAPRDEPYRPLPTKPGSAGKRMPGFDVRIVSDDGDELPSGQMGNIVLANPLAPTVFTTLFKDAARFYKGYLKRFDGQWVDTGDAGMIDADGYVHVMARSDDIINVAAHRFSTGAIEQAVASHNEIAECCVVGIPDQLKGHLPFAFVTLSQAAHPSSPMADSRLMQEVQKRIKQQIGSIAALGGMIQGKGMIPKTRSGKTLRRVLRDLLEHAVQGDFDGDVSVPATIEDADVVEVARAKIKEYFSDIDHRKKHRSTEIGAKL